MEFFFLHSIELLHTHTQAHIAIINTRSKLTEMVNNRLNLQKIFLEDFDVFFFFLLLFFVVCNSPLRIAISLPFYAKPVIRIGTFFSAVVVQLFFILLLMTKQLKFSWKTNKNCFTYSQSGQYQFFFKIPIQSAVSEKGNQHWERDRKSKKTINIYIVVYCKLKLRKEILGNESICENVNVDTDELKQTYPHCL